MDEDGYPTEETISRIRNWSYTDFEGLAAFCHSLWIYDDYSSWDGKVWNVSTGGWSGHEEIISEIPQAWKFLFKAEWRRGGHYIFKR